ncbi:hypothetical protein [Streptomyces gobiensis]|uniref:hypothetical protein n=1 Tax=Streptomyces gobiensis TaxID=2875706 RepID=UPI001E3B3FE6|nr:hypothetical protein [Streptomyces gobiensis]
MSSDFMSATGPLYAWPEAQIQALPEPLPAQKLTTRKNIGPALEPDAYYDLWFHLACQSRRTIRAYIDGLNPALGMACLHDAKHGTAWIQRTGDAHYIGTPALADELATHVQTWANLDQPAISDHYAVFERIDADDPVFHPAGWRLWEDHAEG